MLFPDGPYPQGQYCGIEHQVLRPSKGTDHPAAVAQLLFHQADHQQQVQREDGHQGYRDPKGNPLDTAFRYDQAQGQHELQDGNAPSDGLGEMAQNRDPGDTPGKGNMVQQFAVTRVGEQEDIGQSHQVAPSREA